MIPVDDALKARDAHESGARAALELEERVRRASANQGAGRTGGAGMADERR